MNVYEAMKRIVQYASDYLDIVPDTSANDADVTQVRQMLDAYAALAPDWDNAPDDAKWYTIDANGAATWSEEEPFFSSAGKFPETFWDVNGDYHVDPGDTVFRDDRSGSFAGRAWTLDRRGLPDQSFSDYRPRDVLESAGSD